MPERKFEIFDMLPSTNNYAMQQAHAGMAVHGDAVLALEQTVGKGQRGKTWLAKAGDNISFTKTWQMEDHEIAHQFRLSALVAVAVRHWLASFVTNHKIFIKWPNDIFIDDRKAGGILIENILQGNNWRYAVVGIGVNINTEIFPALLPNAISLKQATGQAFDIVTLAKQLNEILDEFYLHFTPNNWPDIFKKYNQFLYKKNETVRIRKGNVVIPCTIKGVTEDGKLLIEEDEAVAFNFGEISWIL